MESAGRSTYTRKVNAAREVDRSNMTVKYSTLSSSDESIIGQIAIIHENMPSEWRDQQKASEERIKHRIKLLKSQIHRTDFYLHIAETDSGELVDFHWVAMEETNNTKFGHIGSLWVSKKYRKQGIGKNLKDDAEAWVKQQGAAYLLTEVFFDNNKMIEYNKKLGFDTGQVKMRKNL